MNEEIDDDEEEDKVEVGNRMWSKVAEPVAAAVTFSLPFLLLCLLLLLISVAWFLLLLSLLLPRESRGGGVTGGTRGRAADEADDDDWVGGNDTNRSTCEFVGLLKGLETMAS